MQGFSLSVILHSFHSQTFYSVIRDYTNSKSFSAYIMDNNNKLKYVHIFNASNFLNNYTKKLHIFDAWLKYIINRIVKIVN